ncbi:MAG TPA: pyrimidine dimer DNA glycosylase/endonuclease V [Verrucomicrobiae bacterium]|nr:pyrimidine dimer DNA glycosylase/endonuclease V [Verrucomicrobiae bacterium]
MRLWTLHPKYLDAKGLVALWREALLAQKVLRGQTKGYRHHPQLHRFRAHAKPAAAIAAFLKTVHDESVRRGYEFDVSKIGRCRIKIQLPETDGQLLYEWTHLKRKLKARAPEVLAAHKKIPSPEAHPIFKIVSGKIQEWEIVIKPSSSKPRRAAKASARPRPISPRRKSAKSVPSPTRAA